MSYLLDTHALIWWAQDGDRLPNRVREVMAEPASVVHLSAATAWELAIKFNLGKLPDAERLIANLRSGAGLADFRELAISRAHAIRAGTLEFGHKDPFDRLLIAQAQIEGLTLISNERLFDRFGISRMWT